MSRSLKLLPCALVLILPFTARGTPITWAITAQFADPPTTERWPQFYNGWLGTFSYDAGTNQVVDRYFPDYGFWPPLLSGDTIVFYSMSAIDYFGLQLQLAAPLTDAGGIVALIPGSCTNCLDVVNGISGSGAIQHLDTLFLRGPVFNPISSGALTAIPEPAYSLAIALSMLAILWHRRAASRRHRCGH